MWLHWDGNSYADAEAGVFTSATVDGNYTLRSHFRPNSNMSRDDTLFKDDDGKAYFVSAANENADLMLYELTRRLPDDQAPGHARCRPAKREAPAMFKQGGRYYIITSAATGWDPNQAQYFSATSIEGPVDRAHQPRQQHHLRHAVGLRDPGAGHAGDDLHLRRRSLARPRPRRLEVHLAAAQDLGRRRCRSTTTPSGSST